MHRMLSVAIALVLFGGCAPLPLSPEDLQARKFESVPDKAVIYIVRNSPDITSFAGTIWLGETAMITTHPGTYYRWEVAPGTHRISGFARDNASITLRTEAGKIYFVQHSVSGFRSADVSFLQAIGEREGRATVMRGRML
jgi:hypothetical protein